MSDMLAGTISGILMGVVFVGIGAVALFSLLKDIPGLAQVFSKEGSSTSSTAVQIAFISQVAWAIIGLVVGILYRISVEHLSGSGMGSRNLAYTLAVIIVACAMSLPFFILLHRIWKWLLILLVAFVGIFGWFLPFFAG